MKYFNILLILFFSIHFMNAQTFEGIVELKQETAEGLSFDMTWYIKADKIAYEISGSSEQGEMKIRFVPQPNTGTMVMDAQTSQGNTRQVLDVKDLGVPADFDMENIMYSQKGNVFEVSTSKTLTEITIDPAIDIHFAKYAEFFKADYGIHALAQSGKKGFPVETVTKDKSGSMISKITLKNISRTKVADRYFE